MKTESKYINKIYKTELEIKQAINLISKRINEEYKNSDEEVIFMIIAKGGLFYAIDLLKLIDFDCAIEIIFSSSYKFKEKKENSTISFDQTISLKNKRIIIIDDIVDSGETISKIIALLEKYKPKDIAISALFGHSKLANLKTNVYFCWEKNEDEFLVGYGLDYDEKFRNLTYIAIAK